MKVSNVIQNENFKLVNQLFDKDVNGCYISDLLSWVMGKGQEENAWVTIQVHINAIAVAVLKDFSCIVFAEGAKADAQMIEKADEEGISIIETDLPIYEAVLAINEING
ncbi:MAG: AraC family transcriptional regulator [Erysipelotrichaceae bacterium]|nr:AraC family transcriptional regulator [Erysipelotrichaceae bacterium]